MILTFANFSMPEFEILKNFELSYYQYNTFRYIGGAIQEHVTKHEIPLS